jgi:hypothetical protein
MPRDNYSNEKAPKKKKLLPEGWRKFTILGCKPTTSKGGNPMYVFSIQDCETGYEEDIYAVNVEGKRWFLKMMLEALGIVADKKGVTDWDPSQLVNKEFMGLVEHEPNEYINRDGETVKTTQHRITEVKSFEEVEAGVEWPEPATEQ